MSIQFFNLYWLKKISNGLLKKYLVFFNCFSFFKVENGHCTKGNFSTQKLYKFIKINDLNVMLLP